MARTDDQPDETRPGLIERLGRGLASVEPRRALAVGCWLGRLGRLAMPARRRVAQVNLRACFPELDEGQRQRLLRACFEATGMGLAEATLAWWASAEKLASRCSIEGLEHLATPRSNGTLVLMGHCTPIELICRFLSESLPQPPAIMVRRNADPRLEAGIDAGRRAFAAATIEKKNLRAAIRHLRQGGTLLYGPDQNFTYRSVFAPFFGVPAATLTATADLVARTGATLVPVWGWREGDATWRVRVEAPWTDFPSGNATADASRVNAWLESRIREHPEQYLWIHRRFRTRPPGEPPFYPRRARRAKHR